jgi:hypothetical protein
MNSMPLGLSINPLQAADSERDNGRHATQSDAASNQDMTSGLDLEAIRYSYGTVCSPLGAIGRLLTPTTDYAGRWNWWAHR